MKEVSGKRTLVFAVLIVLFIVIWFVWGSILSTALPHTLRVSVLSVGEGRAVLVQSPTGVNVLIDAGPNRTVLRELSKKLGPFNKTLSLVMQTTTSVSSLNGIVDVFDRYNVKALMVTGAPNNTLSAREAARAEGALPHLTHITFKNGMRIHIGGGVVIEVFRLSNSNASLSKHNKSVNVALRIVYGRTSFFLPSDMPASDQHILKVPVDTKGLTSNVLLVGHYGAPNSVDRAFLKMVHPNIAVISVGENRYGYPDSKTVSKLRAVHARVLSTLTNGTVTFSSDGKKIRTSFEYGYILSMGIKSDVTPRPTQRQSPQALPLGWARGVI